MKSLLGLLQNYVTIIRSDGRTKVKLYVGDSFKWDNSGHSHKSSFTLTYISDKEVKYMVYGEGEDHEVLRDREFFDTMVATKKIRFVK